MSGSTSLPKLSDNICQVTLCNPALANVWEKFQIDFYSPECFTIAEACKKANTVFEKVLEDISNESGITNSGNEEVLDDMDSVQLSDHIVRRHHAYITDITPYIHNRLALSIKQFGKKSSEPQSISNLFFNVSALLDRHMRKEEFVLFAFLRDAFRNLKNPHQTSAHQLAVPINMLINEHEKINMQMYQLATRAQAFAADYPQSELPAHIHALVGEFVLDYHIHINKENNLLFPQALREVSSKS